MNKIYFGLIIVFLFSLSLVAATQEGVIAKQNSCIMLKQQQNASLCNITSVIYPDGTYALSSAAMTKAGTEFTYSGFCNTSQIGYYIVNTQCDGTPYPYSLQVTSGGFIDSIGFYFLLFLIIVSIVALGFWIQDGWVVAMGGLALIGFAVYSLVFGLAGFRDTLLTNGTCFFMIGIGAYLSIKSTLEMVVFD